MFQGLAIGFLLLWVSAAQCFATGSAAQPVNENLVEVPAGLSYEIDAQGTSVRVPLTLHDGLQVAELAPPLLFDVAFGKIHASALLGAFKPRLDGDGALLIDIPVEPPLRQGAYDLRLQLRLNCGAKAGLKPLQELVLQIVQPAAQLRQPAALVIQRTFGLLGWADTLVTPLLDLDEQSGRSRVAGIKIDQLDNFASDAGQAADCSLSFKPLASIPAGGRGRAGYDLVCDAPVGTLKGIARIKAAELAGPVDVSIELRSRRTRVWIGLIAFAGLALGYLTRIALPLWVSRTQTRSQGVDELAQIDAEMRRRKDAKFQQDSGSVYSALSGELDRTSDPTALKKAIEVATADLAKALGDLQVRRQATQAKLDQLTSLLETPWSLPPAIATVLNAVRRRQVEANAALVVDDATSAAAACEAARLDLAATMRNPIAAWRTAASGLLDALAAAPVPSVMASGLANSLLQVRGLLNSASDLGASPTLDAITQVVSAIDIARMALQQLLLSLQAWPQDTLTETAAILRPAPLVNTVAVDGLDSAAQEMLKTLGKASEDIESSAEPLAVGLENLDRCWRVALSAQIKDPAKMLAIQASLDEHQYSTAARQVAQLLAGGPLPAPSSTTRLALASPASPWSGITGLGLRPRHMTLAAGRWIVDLSPAQVPSVAVRVARESRTAQLIQTMVAGAGIVLVSYLTNGDKFVGSFADLAAIFSWAFVTDITVNGFIAAMRK
jgi:hypothetical protein